jgi:hypothetical protein
MEIQNSLHINNSIWKNTRLNKLRFWQYKERSKIAAGLEEGEECKEITMEGEFGALKEKGWRHSLNSTCLPSMKFWVRTSVLPRKKKKERKKKENETKRKE